MIGADLGLFADAIQFVADERRLILEKTWEHLQLSGAAMGIALLAALPLGAWLGHLHRGSFIAINLANVGRALPSLAVIAIGIAFLGIGFTNVTLALVTPEDFGMELTPLPFGSIVLRVPDVEAAKEKLRESGVEFNGETFDTGVCNGASFTDPDGNGLAIHRRYAPYLDGSTP